MQEGLGGILGLLVLLSIVLAILWIVLPFYIISMNDKLKKLLHIQKEAQELLSLLVQETRILADQMENTRNEFLPEGTPPTQREPTPSEPKRRTTGFDKMRG